MTSTASPTASTTTGTDNPTKENTKMATYKPSSDSSPQHRKAADADGRMHLDWSDGACLCGCNQKAPRRFRPGHDATTKGKLTRAATNGTAIVLHDGEATAITDAATIARKLTTPATDWSAILERAIARAKKAEEERQARAAKRAAEKAEREAAGTASAPSLSLADFATEDASAA